MKKILQGGKNNYQDLTKENKQQRQYIANIRQQQQQQKKQYFKPKHIKKRSTKSQLTVSQSQNKKRPQI